MINSGIKILFSELEELYELESFEDYGTNYFVFKEEKSYYRIILENKYINIPYLGINIYYGLYENYSDETECYECEFDFYMFFDENNNEIIYEEQGSSLIVCICNYIDRFRTEVNYDKLCKSICNIKIDRGY